MISKQTKNLHPMRSFTLIPYHQGQNRFWLLGPLRENWLTSRSEDVSILSRALDHVLGPFVTNLLGSKHEYQLPQNSTALEVELTALSNFLQDVISCLNFFSFFFFWRGHMMNFFFFNIVMTVEGDQAKSCPTMLKT